MVNKMKYLRRLNRLKLFLIIVFLYSFSIAWAQIEFGVRLAPNLSLTEVREASYIKGTFKTTPLPRVSTGLSVDLFLIKSRLAFATGAWYTIKGVGLASYREIAINYPDGSTKIYENGWPYNLHYIQLPITLKFFMPNRTSASKFYIQAGLTLDWKIAEQAVHENENYFYQLSQTFNNGSDVFNSKDKGLYLGVGREWKTKKDRWLFASLSFTKGRSLLITEHFKFNPNDNLRSWVDYRVNTITLEMGLKFGSKKIALDHQ